MSKPDLPAGTDEVAELRRMHWRELLGLFVDLPCPDLAEMHGEFRSELLQVGHPAQLALLSLALRNPLSSWLGKGFRPVDAETGRGYNAFHRPRRADKIKYPMLTRITLSQYDGKPAFGLIYPAFASPVSAINMIDEVRRYSPNVYLGLGICGFTNAQRAVPIPFLLYGPATPYRGDIGTMFSGFESAERIRSAPPSGATNPRQS